MSYFERYKKPNVDNIKNPQQKRWAEIVRQMATHLDGDCPKHIYIERRPLESKQPYALEYRIKNFKPVTQQEFDKAIGGVMRVLSNVSINVKKDERLQSLTVKGIDIERYSLSNLIRERERDPNALIVLIPDIDINGSTSVTPKYWEAILINSCDIIDINDDMVLVRVGEDKYKISKDGIDIIYQEDNKEISSNLIEYSIDVNPFVFISSIKSYSQELGIEYRRCYFSGAAAWGDKYYAQESDFQISATNNTYLHQFRYKPLCTQIGSINIDGVHCNADTKEPCRKCGGSGYLLGNSPFHITEVPYRTDDENKPLEDMIRYVEPPQNAIKTTKEIVGDYYEAMCDSLGLVSQNTTNQSGISKAFDFEQKLDIIYSMLDDSKRIVKELYVLLTEIYKNIGDYSDVEVAHTGNVRIQTADTLYSDLKSLKEANAIPYLQAKALDAILYNALGNNETTKNVIFWAKKLDRLYHYGNDIVAIKAQLGNSISTTDIFKHNGIIENLISFFAENELTKDPTDYINSLYPSLPTNSLI